MCDVIPPNHCTAEELECVLNLAEAGIFKYASGVGILSVVRLVCEAVYNINFGKTARELEIFSDRGRR